jgi:hypothetical protein
MGKLRSVTTFKHSLLTHMSCGARRRRNGCGPGGGYARKPTGTHPLLLVVGDGSPIAVPCLAR